MKKHFQIIIAASLTLAPFSASGQTREPVAQAAPFQRPGPITPLKIEIVVSRYQGDKKISSLPYTLAVNANDGTILPDGRFSAYSVARLRTGAKVPVATLASPKESPGQAPMGPGTYQAIFRVDISIEDTSMYPDGQTARGAQKLNDIPSFRTFQLSNTVILKEGQSTQFSAAADRISGELIKVDVTLTVMK